MTLWVFWGFKRSLGWADGSCSSDIKTQQRRDLMGADLLLAKERNLVLRSCDWDLLRYLSQFAYLLSAWAKANVIKLSHPKIAASDFADGVILTWR